MGAVTRRFLALLNVTGENATDEVDEEKGNLILHLCSVTIATIASLSVDQTLTLETQL
jgi:hypothetical protein